MSYAILSSIPMKPACPNLIYESMRSPVNDWAGSPQKSSSWMTVSRLSRPPVRPVCMAFSSRITHKPSPIFRLVSRPMRCNGIPCFESDTRPSSARLNSSRSKSHVSHSPICHVCPSGVDCYLRINLQNKRIENSLHYHGCSFCCLHPIVCGDDSGNR